MHEAIEKLFAKDLYEAEPKWNMPELQRILIVKNVNRVQKTECILLRLPFKVHFLKTSHWV